MSKLARAVDNLVDPVTTSVAGGVRNAKRDIVGERQAPSSGVVVGQALTPEEAAAYQASAAAAPQAQPAPRTSKPSAATGNVFTHALKESWSMVKDTAKDAWNLPKSALGLDRPRQSAAAAPTGTPVAQAAPVAHPVPVAAAAAPVAVATAGDGGAVPPAAAAPALAGAPLPDGWGFAYDQQGRVYFLNHKERTTTYEDPRGKY